MKEKIQNTGNELRRRWVAKMPTFFRRLGVVCACIVATAIGINTMLGIAGATPHQWWNDIYPLLIGVPTGMAIVCKLTVAEGYKEVDPDRLLEGNPLIEHKDKEQADNSNDNTQTKHNTEQQ